MFHELMVKDGVFFFKVTRLRLDGGGGSYTQSQTEFSGCVWSVIYHLIKIF